MGLVAQVHLVNGEATQGDIWYKRWNNMVNNKNNNGGYGGWRFLFSIWQYKDVCLSAYTGLSLFNKQTR